MVRICVPREWGVHWAQFAVYVLFHHTCAPTEPSAAFRARLACTGKG